MNRISLLLTAILGSTMVLSPQVVLVLSLQNNVAANCDRIRRRESVRRRSSKSRSSYDDITDASTAITDGNLETTRRDFFDRTSKRTIGVAIAVAAVGTNARRCNSLSPRDAEAAYDSYAGTYDDLDGGVIANGVFGIDAARTELFHRSYGSVLEIGVGTGLNLSKYDFKKLTSLTFVDISENMLLETKKRLQKMKQDEENYLRNNISIRFVQADATSELIDKFGTESFDTVVDSFSLCVFGSTGAQNCLRQIQAVVKNKGKNGQILLLENARSSNPLFGLYQDVTADAAALFGGKGCVYNQDVRQMIQSTNGMEIKKEESFAQGIFRSYICESV